MEAFDMVFGSFLRKYQLLFKDENSEYFLFNISSVICITQRRTNFRFKKAEDKMTALKAGTILGIFSLWRKIPTRWLQRTLHRYLLRLSFIKTLQAGGNS